MLKYNTLEASKVFLDLYLYMYLNELSFKSPCFGWDTCSAVSLLSNTSRVLQLVNLAVMLTEAPHQQSKFKKSFDPFLR